MNLEDKILASPVVRGALYPVTFLQRLKALDARVGGPRRPIIVIFDYGSERAEIWPAGQMRERARESEAEFRSAVLAEAEQLGVTFVCERLELPSLLEWFETLEGARYAH